MARLPDPVVDEIEVIWPENYKDNEKELYVMLAFAIDKAEKNKKNKKKGGKGKDETD